MPTLSPLSTYLLHFLLCLHFFSTNNQQMPILAPALFELVTTKREKRQNRSENKGGTESRPLGFAVVVLVQKATKAEERSTRVEELKKDPSYKAKQNVTTTSGARNTDRLGWQTVLRVCFVFRLFRLFHHLLFSVL